MKMVNHVIFCTFGNILKLQQATINNIRIDFQYSPLSLMREWRRQSFFTTEAQNGPRFIYFCPPHVEHLPFSCCCKWMARKLECVSTPTSSSSYFILGGWCKKNKKEKCCKWKLKCFSASYFLGRAAPSHCNKRAPQRVVIHTQPCDLPSQQVACQASGRAR